MISILSFKGAFIGIRKSHNLPVLLLLFSLSFPPEMKLFQNSYVFDYPWEQVTVANWNKYPNDISTHVVAVDVLRRELKQNNTVLVTERLITVRQGVPRWIMMCLGGDNISYIREVSTVDLRRSELKLRSVNLSYVNFLRVYEEVDYVPHPDDPLRKTLFKQEARITAFGKFSKFVTKVEDWGVQRFSDNALKGKMGFDSILKQVLGEQQQQQ